MKMYSLECPKCGATLDVDNGITTFYCKYCGNKIVLSGMSPEELHSKLKLKEWEHDERMQGSKYAHEERVQETEYKHKEARERENAKSSYKIAILCVLLIIVFWSVLGIHDYLHKAKYTKIENEIAEDVTNKDYDAALLAVNKLYGDPSYSKDEAKTLDQKRESYIKLIREKMAEDKNADSSLVFAPFNSKEVKGMNYQEVVSSLADAGFTNVTLETETDKAIIFKRTNEVDKITISGKTDFTTDDFFEKNAPIKVYYFQ